MLRPSELGQHYRNGESGGEHTSKGNIHAEKMAVFPNALYSLCFSTLSTSYGPKHFLFFELPVGKHCNAITFYCPVANHITVCTKSRACKPIWKPISYHHIFCSHYLETEFLSPFTMFLLCLQFKSLC